MLIWSLWQVLFKPGAGWYYGRDGMDIKAFIWDSSVHTEICFALLFTGFRFSSGNGWMDGMGKHYLHTMHT
ncbi:hypothetical protein DL98DRAFT_509356 [Cadophora sp. DSE1049]|nr:hypothetical protein DL98DRAFT_509356 [Cadophora sp. DSE1049]